MTVFDLQAKLGLDKSGFDKGVREAKGSGQDLGDSLSSSFNKIKNVAKTVLTAAIFTEIINGARQLVDEVARVGDTIDKQSQVLGMSRKAYQEWDYILGQNGASIDALGASMRTLNTVFMSAKEGGDEANDAFAQLGISVHELEQMEPEQQFETLVRALQKLPAGAQKSALAVKLFGRGGTQLLPLLNQSSDSIDKLRERAEELGLIMSDDAVDAAVVYGDSLDDLKRTFNAFKYSIGSQILPVLTNGIQKITNYAGKLRKAYEEKGFRGVFETLVGDIKNIKWPSWEDIKVAVETAWNTIVDGVKGLAEVVFGTNVDGEIDWPTWEEIGEAIGNAWNGIVDGVKGLAKLVFGENVDGSIKWPTWEEIGNAIKEAWKKIVEGVSGLATGIGKVVFGQNVDGTIKWPTWEDIGSAITSAWNDIVSGVAKLPDLIFGEGSAVSNSIKEAIEWIKAQIKGLLDFLDRVNRGFEINASLNPYVGDEHSDADSQSNSGSSGTSLEDYYTDRSEAKGNWRVPYDDYLVKLHRNELVLSASQARRYRDGDSGMDMNALFVGVVGAIREGMDGAQVNSYMDGKSVTNRTNNVTGNRLMARRFAPV